MLQAWREETEPTCPSCGKPMRLARTIPAIGGLPELRVYGCRLCGMSVTDAQEHHELAGRRQTVTA